MIELFPTFEFPKNTTLQVRVPDTSVEIKIASDRLFDEDLLVEQPIFEMLSNEVKIRMNE